MDSDPNYKTFYSSKSTVTLIQFESSQILF